MLSWKALAKCKYLANVSPNTPGIDDLDPFTLQNLDEAIRDLDTNNKHNRLIRESLQKTICHVEDVILGDRFIKNMPTVVDIKKLPQASELQAKGITRI